MARLEASHFGGAVSFAAKGYFRLIPSDDSFASKWRWLSDHDALKAETRSVVCRRSDTTIESANERYG
jgi:hypothetical protein